MGIFSKNSGTKSRSAASTLIAKGCVISGKLKLENDIQVDGVVEGQLHIEGVMVVAESGRVKGEVFAKQLIVNGILEGDCHAEQIQILANGRVKGKVWSNNLSIEPGGKFFGETAELPEKEVVTLTSQAKGEANTPSPASKSSPQPALASGVNQVKPAAKPAAKAVKTA